MASRFSESTISVKRGKSEVINQDFLSTDGRGESIREAGGGPADLIFKAGSLESIPRLPRPAAETKGSASVSPVTLPSE